MDQEDRHPLDERLNKAAHLNEHRFNDHQLARSENEAGNASMDSQSGDLPNQEHQAGWKSTVSEPTQDKGGWGSKAKNMLGKGFGKKTIPIALAGGSILGAIIFLFTMVPTLLITQISKILPEKYNTQEVTLNTRYNKIFARQLSGNATSGMCTPATKALCRYEGLSKRQMDLYKKGGVEIKATKGITGKYKPTEIRYKGRTIAPAGFRKAIEADSDLMSVSKSVYNSRYASVGDLLAGRVFKGRFGTARASPFRDGVNTDEDRDAAVRDTVNQGSASGTINGKKYVQGDDGQWHDPDDPKIIVSEAEALAYNERIDTMGTGFRQGVDDVSGSGNKVADDILKDAETHLSGGGALSKAAGFFKVSDVAEVSCGIHGAMQAVSYGAKVVRTVQMARYAMMFLSMGSMIQAGHAKPEDVSYLANILTKVVNEEFTDESGKKVTRMTKAATDSYGYRYAAYGDTGPLTTSASQYLAGGGMGGKLSSTYNQILKTITLGGGKKRANEVCRVVNNPFVQGISIVAGVGLTIFTGGVGKVLWEAGEAAVTAYAVEAIGTVLIGYLQDLMAGVLVDSTTFGEASGDAITSGTGAMLSTVAAVGGNAPLKAEQAVAFDKLHKETLAKYAEEERATLSPFDPTSKNTFLGNIFFQMIPVTGKTSSFSSMITGTGTVASRAFSSIVTPRAFAEASVEDYRLCQDLDYRELDLATDPFCNPIRGIPPTYLEGDPVGIALWLIENGHVDEQTGEPKSDKYKNFIKNCMDREAPLGYDDNGSTGEGCFIDTEEEAYFYLYRMDTRVFEGLDEGYDEGSGECFDINGGSSGGSSGSKVAQSELDTMLESYGLPKPTPDGVNGYNALLKKIKDEPKATWAAQALLDGEKKYKSLGGDVKEYLNTAWIWFENGSAHWPDPYEVNCNDAETGTSVSDICSGGLIQVAGYQGFDRKSDYVDIFKKLYSEGDLQAVMKQVVGNSTHTIDSWSYQNSTQKANLSKWGVDVDNLGSVTLQDISPNSSIIDPKSQILTFILGKDPNMAAALNSFAVSEGDVIYHLKNRKSDGCGVSWAGYICEGERQLMANMIMALYMFDGTVASSSSCISSSAGRAMGEGISVIWGGKGERNLDYGLGADAGLQYYDYGIEMGLGGTGTKHTGVDVGDELGAPLYSPVNGTVMCSGTGKGTSVDGTACGAFNDYMGEGNGRIEIKPDGTEDIVILGHTSTSIVDVGDHVTIGQQVGTVGGMNGPHTHVEVRVKDPSLPIGWRLVDPIEYLGGV